MARSAKVVALLFILAAAVELASAQQCPSVIGLRPCLAYANGSAASPSQQCCNVLKDTSRWTDSCLCKVATSGQFGIKREKVFMLPKLCKRTIPRNAKCAGTPIPR